jgi:xanthosine utilization system XapX-like protein
MYSIGRHKELSEISWLNWAKSAFDHQINAPKDCSLFCLLCVVLVVPAIQTITVAGKTEGLCVATCYVLGLLAVLLNMQLEIQRQRRLQTKIPENISQFNDQCFPHFSLGCDMFIHFSVNQIEVINQCLCILKDLTCSYAEAVGTSNCYHLSADRLP